MLSIGGRHVPSTRSVQDKQKSSAMSDALAFALGTIALLFVAFLILVVKFPEQVSQVVANVRNVSVSAGKEGFSFSLNASEEKAVDEALSKVLKAIKGQPQQKAQGNTIEDDLAAIAVRVSQSLLPPRILWVDDKPDGNKNVTDIFRSLGIDVVIAKNSDAAIQIFETKDVTLVISDLGREEKTVAAKDLPEKFANVGRNNGSPFTWIPPFIFYVGRLSGPTTEHGWPVTNSPTDLVHLVRRAFYSYPNWPR